MTIAFSTRYIKYSPTVSTDTYDVPFPIFATEDLQVFVDGVEVFTFSVTATFSDGRSEDARIVLASSVVDVDVEIYGAKAPARANSYLLTSANLASLLQFDVDVLTAIVQEQARDVAAALLAAADAKATVDGVASNAAAAAASASAAAASATAAQAAENSLLEWAGAWTTATAYAPSDIVSNGGHTYICLIAHTSGVFATDTLAGRWDLFVSKGDVGPGGGDVLAGNNGTEFDAPTFRANLELLHSKTAVLSSVDLDTVTTSGVSKIGASVTNGWSGIAAGDMLLTLAYASTEVVQIGYRAAAEPIMYMRRSVGGSWGSWYSLASRSYVDGLTRRVLLATKTPSGAATVDFTEFDNGTYSRYEFEFDNFKPSTDSVNLCARTSTDGGSSYDSGSSDYRWACDGRGGSGGTAGASNGDTLMQINGGVTLGNAASEYGFSGEMTLRSAPDAAAPTRLGWKGSYYNTVGTLFHIVGEGARVAAADVDAIRFFFSAGNCTGTVRMFGVK